METFFCTSVYFQDWFRGWFGYPLPSWPMASYGPDRLHIRTAYSIPKVDSNFKITFLEHYTNCLISIVYLCSTSPISYVYFTVTLIGMIFHVCFIVGLFNIAVVAYGWNIPVVTKSTNSIKSIKKRNTTNIYYIFLWRWTPMLIKRELSLLNYIHAKGHNSKWYVYIF